jgi:hypothetical protein
LKVFATFELNRIALEEKDSEACRDALQPLNTVASLHNQNIRFDFLKRAMVNPTVERRQKEEDNKTQVQDWSKWWSETKFAILAYIFKNKSQPATNVSGPCITSGWWYLTSQVIREGQRTTEFDPDRLRLALRQLIQFSLLIHNDRTDAYSIHPLVHKWARERPETVEQAAWSEAAAVLLSNCIVLPPLGNTAEEEEVRKYLLPDVQFVSARQEEIAQWMRDKRMARMKP